MRAPETREGKGVPLSLPKRKQPDNTLTLAQGGLLGLWSPRMVRKEFQFRGQVLIRANIGKLRSFSTSENLAWEGSQTRGFFLTIGAPKGPHWLRN